ncbi:acireductone synthase [Streptomyces sp. MspMP-M5]|uniref:acireductone synthase n=1 Tax=unclassified Streptomyces TaxID=2593676 RepID=UPI00036129B3|nr:acireductone synthase [Streptomyces sp. MspMP-M5]MYT33681.1 acireductone synthase [Streptomyces sp. SID8354]
MITATVRAVVLDIEGTTGSLSHVHDVLFPYARQRLADWFTTHRNDPRHAEILQSVRDSTGTPDLDDAGAIAVLTAWADADVKAAPLKRLQGLIWAQGYADGTLTGHVYPDVPEALDRWRAAGIGVHIYSSGSVGAQRDWFAHSDHGDLTHLLLGYFDLDRAGPKREPESYRAIVRAIGGEPPHTLFLSDVAEELDAAAAAGWLTAGVRRARDPRGPIVPGHPSVPSLSLDHVRLQAYRPTDPDDTNSTHPTGPTDEVSQT